MKQSDILALTAAVHRFLVGMDDARLKSYLTDWPSPKDAFRAISPCDLPVRAYMPEAIKTVCEKTGDIVSMLAGIVDQIAWGQTYSTEDFGVEFLKKYGWTEFIGQRGPIPSERMACGILMLGPQVEYPRHRHEAEEIYIPLTGETRWQQGDQEWTLHPLGRPIYHAPWVPHAMKTGSSPLLALYIWRAGDLAQKSLIG